jgi:hypothetical protein
MIGDKNFWVIGSILKNRETGAFHLHTTNLSESERMKLVQFLKMITEDMHNRLMQDMRLVENEHEDDY